jgi:hypothetical protein
MKKVIGAAVFLVMVFFFGGEVFGAGFSGTVTNVNLPVQTISVSDRGRIVTFDISNPVLKGYRSVAGIRIGDRVEVTYIREGIRVAKISGTPSKVESVARKPGTETGISKPGVTKSKKEGRARVSLRTNGTGFDEVDENKDGRISPVELTVIIPSLTREEFKQYDLNGDGYLDRKEFKAVKRP